MVFTGPLIGRKTVKEPHLQTRIEIRTQRHLNDPKTITLALKDQIVKTLEARVSYSRFLFILVIFALG